MTTTTDTTTDTTRDIYDSIYQIRNTFTYQDMWARLADAVSAVEQCAGFVKDGDPTTRDEADTARDRFHMADDALAELQQSVQSVRNMMSTASSLTHTTIR